MRRGGTALALGIVFSLWLAPAAAGGTHTADVFLKEKGDEYFAGEDLLSVDGVGQSRSLIVTDQIVVIVKVQNDGDERATFTVQASPADLGFEPAYIFRGRDVTGDVVHGLLELVLEPGAKRTIQLRLDASEAEFAAEFHLLFLATSADGAADAARAEITKID